jgi:hypothetical protein
MKTALFSFVRTLPIVAALAASAALVCEPATAARGAGGWHGGAGGGHGGGYYHGGYRGGYYHGGYRGYYWPGAFWGGIGIGIGIGAVGYYGGYYRGYYAPYYAPYYTPYYAPYYDGYYDPALVVSPVYSTAEPGAARVGQPVPQASAPAEPIFYPRNGQSAETTESDRRECNRWATTQRGAMDDASIFQRATLACMEGRGYTVK